MSCPHLIEDRLTRCDAVSGILVPTIHERERFCRSAEACRRCPTLLAYERRGARLPQEVYYAIWLPPAVELERAATRVGSVSTEPPVPATVV
jgi:hypothetical protein